MQAFVDELRRAWFAVAARMGEIARIEPVNGGAAIEEIAVIPLMVESNKQIGDIETWQSADTIEYWFTDLGRELARGDIVKYGNKVFVVRGILANNGYSVQVEVGRVTA